jgi:hypothetical protein
VDIGIGSVVVWKNRNAKEPVLALKPCALQGCATLWQRDALGEVREV